MGLIGKLFNTVPEKEREGITLDFRSPQWKVSSPKIFSSFLRALAELIPPNAIVYIEGGSPRKELQAFLEEKSVHEVSHVAMGTIWPRPKMFHVPATSENLFELADISEHYAEPEVAIHFHVYKNNQVLLQWYDAFADPIYVSKEISEDKIKAFCEKLELQYETDTEGVEQPDQPYKN